MNLIFSKFNCLYVNYAQLVNNVITKLPTHKYLLCCVDGGPRSSAHIVETLDLKKHITTNITRYLFWSSHCFIVWPSAMVLHRRVTGKRRDLEDKDRACDVINSGAVKNGNLASNPLFCTRFVNRTIVVGGGRTYE